MARLKLSTILLLIIFIFGTITTVPLITLALACPPGQSPYTFTDPTTGVSGQGCAASSQVTPQGTLQEPPSLPSLPSTGGQGGGQQQQGSQQVTTQVSLPNPLAANDIADLIDRIATWLLTIGLLISTIAIIWSAFQFMISGGNKERVEKARKTIWYAVIGIVVLLLAKGITSIIAGFLGG